MSDPTGTRLDWGKIIYPALAALLVSTAFWLVSIARTASYNAHSPFRCARI